MVFEAKTVREGGDQVASAFADCGPAQRLAAFVQAESQRGLCRPSGEH